jgi:hypothetical protein
MTLDIQSREGKENRRRDDNRCDDLENEKGNSSNKRWRPVTLNTIPECRDWSFLCLDFTRA